MVATIILNKEIDFVFFYFALPVTIDADPIAVYSAAASVPVEIGEALVVTYNGEPINVDGDIPVTIDVDGYPVVMSKHTADRLDMPATETDDEYINRLCRLYYEAKPWLAFDDVC